MHCNLAFNNSHVQHQDQHDYLTEFSQLRRTILIQILRQESLADGGMCHDCQSPEGLWRCLDCQSRHALCRHCLRNAHEQNPFHRIQFWSKNHYETDWLYNVGIVINLGHHGSPCSLLSSNLKNINYDVPMKKIRSSKDFVNAYNSPSQSRDIPDDVKTVTVVHTNGVHQIWIRRCVCTNSLSTTTKEFRETDSFLQAALFPSTFKSVRSAFTFSVLDDFRKANLHCKTTAYAYWRKLKHQYSEFFPSSCPVSNLAMFIPADCRFHQDRYREFSRVTRQWRNLKLWKWGGVPYNTADPVPDAGSLAFFCLACPQPGINLPSNWESDPDTLAYTRTFVTDGNFTAIHNKDDRARPAVPLTAGDLFMVEESNYAAHLATAQEIKEVCRYSVHQSFIQYRVQESTCHQHRAIADKFTKYAGLDISGIGATACSRHGVFCPGGCVNFQQGEGYVSSSVLFGCRSLMVLQSEEYRFLNLSRRREEQYLWHQAMRTFI